MRIQPIDSIPSDTVKPPVFKSRLKRLFDRPFNSVLRISSAEKPVAGGDKDGGGAAEIEPSSVCLDKMVQNFMEDNNDKPSSAARNRCNCFNGNSNDSSDDELGFFSDSISANSSFSDPSDALRVHNYLIIFDCFPFFLIGRESEVCVLLLQSLTPCATVAERNLLADASKIVEKNKTTCKRKDDLRKVVTDGLITLGYNASLCKSKWDKSPSIPAGNSQFHFPLFSFFLILLILETN